MVEFWGMFVVFSACTAFQITESRDLNNAHAPPALTASQNLADLSINVVAKNSPRFVRYAPPKKVKDSSEESDKSDESAESAEAPAKSTKHLSLFQRCDNLWDFSIDGIKKYEKDFLRLTRVNLKAIHNELETLPKKSDDIAEKLKDIKEALREIDQVDLVEEPTDFNVLENAMDTVVYLGLEPENNVTELEEVLEKTGWIDMRNKLTDELNEFLDKFGEKYDAFIATLTPWERLMCTGLVDLHKRFTKADKERKWHILNEYWDMITEKGTHQKK